MKITPEDIIEFIDDFHLISEKEIQDDIKITCFSNIERGFCIDVEYDDMGFEELIMTHWIEHDRLLKIIEESK